MASRGKDGYQQLPQELQHRVIGVLHETEDWQTIANLRLVSKTCLAAVQQYPGSLRITQPEKLEDLPSLMPNMQNLAIRDIERSFTDSILDLHALEQCTKLTSLDLVARRQDGFNFTDYPNACQVVHLPGSLKQLKTVWINFSKDSFISTRHLTSLTIQGGGDWTWMDAQQKLKVSLTKSSAELAQHTLSEPVHKRLFIYPTVQSFQRSKEVQFSEMAFF